MADGSMTRVGSYINEAMVPAMARIDMVWRLTFATPQGNKPPLDGPSPARQISSLAANRSGSVLISYTTSTIPLSRHHCSWSSSLRRILTHPSTPHNPSLATSMGFSSPVGIHR